MEYKEEDGVAGSVPGFGAIFMSNGATKRECLRRKLFGLPSVMSAFVKQVKAGMVLFLFEFERRELFGVYKAVSDGEMNIVPHAFRSSGKQFPAQVRVTAIWRCDPLAESEFSDAIRENYFSAKKFNFGLSEDQVKKLLVLFSSRKLIKKFPQGQLNREVLRPDRKVERAAIDDTVASNEIEEIEFDEGDGFGFSSLVEKPGLPIDGIRTNVDKFSVADRIDNKHEGNSLGQKLWTELAGGPLFKRKIENEHRFLVNNVTENESHDYHGGQSFMNDLVENERNMVNLLWPLSSTTYSTDLFGEAKRETNDSHKLINHDGSHNDADDKFLPCVSTERIGNLLDRVGRVSDYGRFCSNANMEAKYRLDMALEPVAPVEQPRNSMVRDRLSIDERRFSVGHKPESANELDGSLHSAGSGCTSGEYRLLSADGMFLKNGRIENSHSTGSYLGPDMSNGFAAIGQSKEIPLVNSTWPTLESDYCLDQDPHGHPSLLAMKAKFDLSYPRSHDAVVTSAAPYDPELPDIHYGHSSPFTFGKSSSVQDFSFHNPKGSNVSLSKSGSSSDCLEPQGLSRCLDGASDFQDKVQLPHFLNHHDYSCRTGNRDLDMSACKAYRGKLFSDPSLPCLLFPGANIPEWGNDLPLDHNRYSSSKYDPQIQRVDEDALGAQDFLPLDVHSSEKESVQDENEYYQHCNGMVSDSQTKRTSVFARLSLDPKARMQKEHYYDSLVAYDDTPSVDEIMNMLCNDLNLRAQKLVKHRRMVRQHDYDKISRKEVKIDHKKEYDHPKKAIMKEEASGIPAMVEDADFLPKESRVVEFKRRSDARRVLGNISPEGSSASAAAESLEANKMKRRKLVRPIFITKSADVGKMSS